MLQYVKYLFGFILLCSQVTAMERETAVEELPPIKVTVETRVNGKVDDLAFRSITKGDALTVEAIIARCAFKEGLTQNTTENPLVVNNMAQNLETRISIGNPYSGLILSIDEKPVGFLTLGVMPALGLKDGYILSQHKEIIDTFRYLGAIKPKKGILADAKFAPESYKKVDNCGLAMLVPALPRGSTGLNEKQIRDALRIGVSVCQTLKDEEKTLPQGEDTLPGYVVGLFSPEDPLIPDLKAVGFTIDNNEGFFKFYDKERVLAYIKLK